jgi:hypothetical protein
MSSFQKYTQKKSPPMRMQPPHGGPRQISEKFEGAMMISGFASPLPPPKPVYEY